MTAAQGANRGDGARLSDSVAQVGREGNLERKHLSLPLGLNKAQKGSRRVTKVDFSIIAKFSPKIWFSCNNKKKIN